MQYYIFYASSVFGAIYIQFFPMKLLSWSVDISEQYIFYSFMGTEYLHGIIIFPSGSDKEPDNLNPHCLYFGVMLDF